MLMSRFTRYVSLLILLITLGLIVTPTPEAHAFPITIDPGGYTFRYTISGVGWYTGQVTLNLSPGTYHFENGLYKGTSIGTSSFRFVVDGTGQITSVFNNATNGPSGAAVGIGSTLKFNTVNVAIDPDGYTQSYFSPWSPLTGARTFILLPDVLYRISAGGQLGYFMPHVTDVTPSSLTLTIGGRPYTFLFTIGAEPVANAGPDQTVAEGSPVALNGLGSVGQNLTFSWVQLAGPTVEPNNASSPTAAFTAPQLPGGFGSQTLTFQLTVSNGFQSSLDTVNVLVANVNHAPVAVTGDNQIVKEGSNVTISGASSFDPDGDAITYQWAQTGGPDAALSGENTPTATFTAPNLAGGVGSGVVLTFALVVSDGVVSSADEVSVTVEQENHAAVADAGKSRTVNSGTFVTLNGSASSDPDGDPLVFQWTQVDGPTVALANATSSSPSFTAPPVVGPTSLTFRLTVSDSQLLSAPAFVMVTVVRPNDPPVCDLAQPIPALMWPPNHGMVLVRISGVTDPNNDGVAITIARVTQDEPVNGLGDGDTSPDAAGSGNQILLRAERAGTGNGRMYQVHFTASDVQGGQCSGSVKVNVPHSKKDPAIDSGQIFNSFGP